MQLSEIKEFIGEAFFSSYKKTAGTLVAIIILLSMPVTYILIQHRQTLYQHAAGSCGTCTPPNVCLTDGTNYLCGPNPNGQNIYNGTIPCGVTSCDYYTQTCQINPNTGVAGCVPLQKQIVPPVNNPPVQPPASCTYGSCSQLGSEQASGDTSGYYLCNGTCWLWQSCPVNQSFNGTRCAAPTSGIPDYQNCSIIGSKSQCAGPSSTCQYNPFGIPECMPATYTTPSPTPNAQVCALNPSVSCPTGQFCAYWGNSTICCPASQPYNCYGTCAASCFPPTPTPTRIPAITIPTATPTNVPAAAPTPTRVPTPTPTRVPTATPTPTTAPTATPTPTSVPGGSVLVSATLPGIGTDTAKGENNSPKHPQRLFTAYAVDSQGKVASSVTFNVNYSNGEYSGKATFPNLANGLYDIKVKAENSLVKQIPGIYNLTLGGAPVQTIQVALVTGDVVTSGNSNNVLDISDYNALLNCITGGSCDNNAKTTSDLNDDGTVDAKDLNILLRGFATRVGD